MLGVYRLSFGCGRRNDDLVGVFVEESARIEALINSKVEVDFGEAAGKHSHVYGSVEEHEIKLLTSDEDFISKFQSFDLGTGYNPFSYQDLEGHDIRDLVDEYIKNLADQQQ